MENKQEMDELRQVAQTWKGRANFWVGVVATWAGAQTHGDQASSADMRPDMQYIVEMVVNFIDTALDAGEIRAVDDSPIEDVSSIAVTWPIVVEIANEFGVDAAEILKRVIARKEQGLHEAYQLRQAEWPDAAVPRFNGVPISRQMAEDILLGIFDGEFEKKFADQYIVHVMHGERPCQHPASSLEEALRRTVEDLQTGEITGAHNITLNGREVMSKEVLRQCIMEMGMDWTARDK